MKIKVINLLINLANGTTYTKKARIRYFDRKNDYKDECILNDVAIGYRLYNQNIELNDEVEILEEEKKIPEKIDLAWQNAFDEQVQQDCIKMILENINIILDYLKSKGDE